VSAADATETAESPGLEEIVVTAEKRESTVQHTALDIAVFSGATLQDQGIEDFTTLYKVAPNVNVNSGGVGGIGATVIAINGIHAYDISNSTQSPIAVNLDGVYLARMTGLTGIFYDLQRVEELAGPQGTLYGRNATGGAVNVLTNKPGHEFGAEGTVEAGNYGESRVEGALNLPLSDTFSLRFAGREYQHKGYFSNGLSDAHEDGGRLSALWNITGKATLSASADYETSNDHDQGLGLVGVRNLAATANPNGTYTVNPGPNVAVPTNPYSNTSVLYPDGRGTSTNNSEIKGAMLQFDYDFDFATLTSQLGYRAVNAYAVFLEPPSPVGTGPGGSVLPGTAPLLTGGVGTQDLPQQSKSYSAEVRLASTATTPLQWVTGLYGFKEDQSGEICVQASYTVPACVFNSGPTTDAVSYAAFFQTTYTPPFDDNKIHVVIGGRYNHDEVSGSTSESAVFPLTGAVPVGHEFVLAQTNLDKVAEKGTYKLGLNYDLTPDNLLYASNSTGYRSFNYQYGTYYYAPPETIHAWDFGSKNEFWNRRLQVNFDAFIYEYYGSDRSEQTYPPPFLSFLPFGEITSYSSGHSRYKGLSFDVHASITQDDRASLALQYLDTRYVDFVLPAIFKNTTPENYLGIPTGQATGVFTGDPIAVVPPWAGTAGYDHDWHVFGGTVTGRLDAQFASRTEMADADPGTLQAVERAGYIQGDVLLRFAPKNDMWSVSAWCRNVTDKIVWTSAIYQGTANNGLVTATLAPPRTFGITVTAKVGHP
jgi:iron complex outermembrane receptor protein